MPPGLRARNEKAKKPPGSEHGTSFELNVVKWQGSSGILGRNVELNRTQMSFELMSLKA